MLSEFLKEKRRALSLALSQSPGKFQPKFPPHSYLYNQYRFHLFQLWQRRLHKPTGSGTIRLSTLIPRKQTKVRPARGWPLRRQAVPTTLISIPIPSSWGQLFIFSPFNQGTAADKGQPEQVSPRNPEKTLLIRNKHATQKRS